LNHSVLQVAMTDFYLYLILKAEKRDSYVENVKAALLRFSKFLGDRSWFAGDEVGMP
jgi:glutathione S-transferase